MWPIYATDLESENPIESMELKVQPERRKPRKKNDKGGWGLTNICRKKKFNKKLKRTLLLWNCRWQALILRMKVSKRNRINLSSSSRNIGRISNFLDEWQQHPPPWKKSKRSQDIDDLGGGSTSRIEKQEETQPLHRVKKFKKRKRNAEK